MSADKKPHEYELTALAVMYLRNALSNPQWATDIQDWVDGSDALRPLPRLSVPKDIQSDDDAVLAWASETKSTILYTDPMRDAARKAMGYAFKQKTVPINEHTTLLIRCLGLK
jgi:hypothetical protein